MIFSEWYLARDKGWQNDLAVAAYPATETGIIKKRGCVMYKPTDRQFFVCVDGFDRPAPWYLKPSFCKKIFGHCPKKGELLCVKKTRSGWKSEKIELAFSD